MIHHSVDGGTSSRRKVWTASSLWRGWKRKAIGVCAGLLAVVGGSRAVAQQPATLPPIGAAPSAAVSNLPQADFAQAPTSPPSGNDPTKGATLMPPRPLSPFGPGQIRLPRVPGDPSVVGATPKPTPEVLREYGNYVGPAVAPAATLDLIVGRPLVLRLKEVPKRIQVADEAVASYTLVTPMELSVLPRNVGSTVLNIWFIDAQDKTKEKVLSYLVRVAPDPEWFARMQQVYKALEVQINGYFPDSRVSLVLAGEKLLVCGQAKDVAEANYIIDILRANAPGGVGLRRETPAVQAYRIPVDRLNAEADPRLVPDQGGPPGILDYPLSGGPLIVNLLRVPGEQQVQLQVTVAEVNRAAARTIGLNFNIFNRQGGQIVASNIGGIVPVGIGQSFAQFSSIGTLNNSVANNLPVALDNGQIQLAISALRELNYSRLLAEPVLTTINGQPANFQAGNLYPIPYLTGGFGAGAGLEGVGYIPVGVQLTFTPYITDKDRIRLVISAEVSDRDPTLGATVVAGSEVPILDTRNFSNTVELREGQTLAVAGLIQNRLGANSVRVPFFGDLPLIGRLAAFDQIAAEEQELVFLITPELVHPMEPKQVPPLPGSDLFEPGDLEFYLLGRLESRRSYDYRSPVMTDIHRMLRYRHCEQLYITGPQGHCADGACNGGAPLPQ
jgi:pilus assembly protein CpaC